MDAPFNLAQILRRVADTNLDPDVHIAEVVKSAGSIASQVAFGTPPGPSGQAGTPVYVVVMRGNFVAEKVSVPYGQPQPTGTVITLLLSADTGKIGAFGIGNQVPDLPKLGSVQTVTF